MIPEKVTNAVAYLVSKGAFADEATAYEAFLDAWRERQLMQYELGLLAEAEHSGPPVDAETVFADIAERLKRMGVS
jgi:hypothetical protein